MLKEAKIPERFGREKIAAVQDIIFVIRHKLIFSLAFPRMKELLKTCRMHSFWCILTKELCARFCKHLLALTFETPGSPAERDLCFAPTS